MKILRILLIAIATIGPGISASKAQLKEIPELKADVSTFISGHRLSDKQNTLKVTIDWRVAPSSPKHEFEMAYQFRIHTKAGEYGPILTTKSHPNGVSWHAGTGIVTKEGGLKLTKSYTVDITTFAVYLNLPKNESGVIIRLEPQIFDKDLKAFVSEPKTEAFILVLETNDEGKAISVQTLGEWFRDQFKRRSRR